MERIVDQAIIGDLANQRMALTPAADSDGLSATVQAVLDQFFDRPSEVGGLIEGKSVDPELEFEVGMQSARI